MKKRDSGLTVFYVLFAAIAIPLMLLFLTGRFLLKDVWVWYYEAMAAAVRGFWEGLPQGAAGKSPAEVVRDRKLREYKRMENELMELEWELFDENGKPK